MTSTATSTTLTRMRDRAVTDRAELDRLRPDIPVPASVRAMTALR